MKGVPEIDELLGLLQPDGQALEKGKERQSAVAKSESTDYLPLLLHGMGVPERKRYCHQETLCRYNHREQFYDKRKMLFERLFDLISLCRGDSDAQLSLPVEMGAGFLPSVLGLHQGIFEDKDPWLQERLSKKAISQLEPGGLGDVSAKGLMPRALEYMAYFKQLLEGKALVHVDYTWGPFSLAHLIRGDDVFTDLYDDPPFVHHLMEIATELYVSGSMIVKEAIAEPNEQGYQGGFFMANCGVWSNEDTAVLLSLAHLEEFVFPYLRKAYAPFGGAVVHFCGRADYLLDSLLDLPEVKGINLGEPEWQKLSYEQIMTMVLDKGKTYYGAWSSKGENARGYFQRMLGPLEGGKRGLVLSYDLAEQGYEDPDKLMGLWHSLQN